METNASQNRPNGPASSLPAFVALLIAATVLSAGITTAALLLGDRLDRPAMVVGPGEAPTIAAQIEGAVATPGVYPLPAGARLDDLVTSAGGLTANADVADVNLAARVGDGERVAIPTIERATPTVAPDKAEVEDTAPLMVNVNTASVAELDRLPGIGPVLGERIVAYREANGPFTSLDDLTKVDGISDRVLERMRPLITLDD